jgi:phage shock protein E
LNIYIEPGDSVMLKTAGDLIKEAQQHIKCLDVETAKKFFDGNDNLVIIDVREAASAAESKLSCSINISRGLIEMKIPKVCPEADTVILTHCGGGGRASLAAHSLQQMGYTNVYAITASFDDLLKTFG